MAAATLAQKLIARAAGLSYAKVGEIVTAQVDLAMIHDSGGPRRVAPLLAELGVGLHDRSRVVLISDHYVPGDTKEAQQILRFTRDWAQQQSVNFYDAQGICHVVLPERGHLRPGMFVVGGDSHSCTGGAFGAFMFGVGATDMAAVLATGEIWLRVPATILIKWQNQLPPGVTAKDMMLYTCGQIGMDGGEYQAIEFCGAAVTALPMQERMTLSNMAAELGAQVGLIAPDAVTQRWLAALDSDAVAVPDLEIQTTADLYTDAKAEIYRQHHFDAAALQPQVAAPHSPANAMPVTRALGTRLNMAYLGACTGAKYQDIQAAAQLLRKRKIANGMQLRLAPASMRDQQRAAEDGSLAVLLDAGAQLLPSACGICAGYGADRLAADSVCISSTARNFKGRMGNPAAQVWLASPLTVAASAIAGEIADPREFLAAEQMLPAHHLAPRHLPGQLS